MKSTTKLALLATVLATAAILHKTDHLLVFTTAPIQVCIGWPDDRAFSYWCTPDYTARPPQ
jgi:hypothetical protein